jgi:hypothetical protein
MRPKTGIFYGLLILWIIGGVPVLAQDNYGTRLGLQLGDEASLSPQGPSVALNVLDPAVRRWYVPQELYKEYQWRQWQYTNYARDPYERYVATTLEGDYFYDLYGNFLTRGWLIFNNSQTTPQQFGNVLFKSSRFQNWFSEVVVAQDHKGQYFYTLTASSRMRSILSPMVFSKARMDGVQFDLATDRYEGTFLFSRLSNPGGGSTGDREVLRTNNTILVGGRLGAQLGDFVEVALHTANAHQSHTLLDRQEGNPFAGSLTIGQNKTVSLIQVVLRDDSPEDGIGGAAFFPDASDVLITYRDGTVESGKEILFEPVIEGGFVQEGFISADGSEEMRLFYDFDSPDFVDRARFAKDEIIKVEFQLTLGNDYQVWMTSDRQVNLDGQTVLLLIEQADGNVQDITNLRTVSFEYGLPTATHVFGGSVEVRDFKGFDLYGEYDLSWSYRKYPNVLKETHKAISGIRGQRAAPAWMVNASKKEGPYFAFGEFYSMDPRYNTQTYITSGTGDFDYDNERSLVDFVDDNDDQDKFPDNVRFDFLSGDLQVFPGWDQNNDFVPDFNQNDTFVRSNSDPDYEEAFLRFYVDRPEFLFGVDMNNNFWVDQYENDEEPDYPYRKDHQGFNIHVGADITPQARLVVGTLHEELISSNRKNESNYLMFTYEGDTPRLGRFRIFEMSKLVKDDIPNPLLQWAPDNTLRGGELTKVEDPLLARNTWVNQLFLGHNLQVASFYLMTKVNWLHFNQQMKKAKRQEFGLEPSDFFFGLINKTSYRFRLGAWSLEPRWKSEFRKQSRSLISFNSTTSLMELFSGLVETKMLQVTKLQGGIEYAIFNDFDEDLNDFNAVTGAFQFSNESNYLGYKLRALMGIKIERKDFKGQKARTTNESFVTIYAGLN